MKPKRQEELINLYLSSLDGEHAAPFRQLIEALDTLGYSPQKVRNSLSFKHEAHNKQLAKLGIRAVKSPRPFFALRFSACRDYPKRFTDIVERNIVKYPHKTAGCTEGKCNFCAGAPETHVYVHTFPNGETKAHCGAYALEIPNISAVDIPAIKKLIAEEHEYLMKHEAYRT